MEDDILGRMEEYETVINSAAPLKEDFEKWAAIAKKDLAEAKVVQIASAKAYTSACKEMDEMVAAWQDSKKAFASAKADYHKAVKKKEWHGVCMEQFRTGPLASFKELKNMSALPAMTLDVEVQEASLSGTCAGELSTVDGDLITEAVF